MNDIDELYESGQMPEWYYNQVNGKSAFENYKRHIKKQQKRVKESRKKKDDESFLFKLIKETLATASKEALKDLLEDFASRP